MIHTSWGLEAAYNFKRFLLTMAVAGAALVPISSSAYVLGPTTPGKWGSPVFGTGATVTYSYMNDGVSCAAEFGGCTITRFGTGGFGPSLADWKTAFTAAFASWSAVADITFTEVADDGAAFNAATTSGDIRLGGHTFDGVFGTLAHGYYPPANGATAAGDIHFDTGDCWELAADGTGDGCFNIFQVAAHEIGHAIGLDHTAVAASLMNPFYTEAISGPQADDIAGAVFIYGPAAVPEPTSLSLMGMAFVAAALARRRRRAGA